MFFYLPFLILIFLLSPVFPAGLMLSIVFFSHGEKSRKHIFPRLKGISLFSTLFHPKALSLFSVFHPFFQPNISHSGLNTISNPIMSIIIPPIRCESLPYFVERPVSCNVSIATKNTNKEGIIKTNAYSTRYK